MITIYVIPNNDALPENNETVTIAVTNTYANSLYPFTASGSGTVTIKDDDGWTISSSVTDTVALEPCTWIPGNERTGAFEITKSGGQDWTYSIMVKFEMSGTATPRNVGQSADYHLTTNPNGGVAEDMITVSLQNDQWIGSIVLPANQESVTLYVMPDGDSIFEDDETVILTIIDAYAVQGFSFNIDNSGGDVTIWHAPEFISDTEPAGTFNIPINFDVYNVPTVVFDTLDLDAAFFQVNSYHNRPVQYAIISGNDEGIFRIDADTGELFLTGLPTTLSIACTLMVRAEDAEYPLQYDMATVNIKGVSVEEAKEAIEQVYQECRNDISWQFGTNTCQRFAFLFENKLRELRESDENVRLASSDSVVTYTLSGIISITSPKHAAVRIIFADGSVLFYDNGAFGGIYTEHPDWATPDF